MMYDQNNPFQWSKMVMNVPGIQEYDPTKSWLSKIRVDGQISCDLFTFVDNKHITRPMEELTWQASHTLAAKKSYLGIQDAAHKV